MQSYEVGETGEEVGLCVPCHSSLVRQYDADCWIQFGFYGVHSFTAAQLATSLAVYGGKLTKNKTQNDVLTQLVTA